MIATKKLAVFFCIIGLINLSGCSALSNKTPQQSSDPIVQKLRAATSGSGIKVSRIDRTGTFKFVLPADAAFAKNSAQLSPASYHSLNVIAKVMQANPQFSAKIAGHTDFYGTLRYNQLLSEKRAQSIAHYLAAHGIQKHRLQTAGYGINEPIASNKSRQGRAQNRRVEIILY